ncbi:histamine N-methyltransferase-like [Ptychodera flava]|uniref:histamine N-methyltransferase-like n=1 Tax=Ptychodera flava TaxID=63121 RepID=UPI003969CAF8
MKALIDLPEEYHEGFSTMKRYGYNYAQGQREKDLKDSFEQFVFCRGPDSELRVFAVGSSDGNSDIPIIETLTIKHSSIKYIVVEPAECQIKKFQNLVTSKTEVGLWTNINFEFHQTTIEEYLNKIESGKATGGFDIIHLLNSAYYLDDPERVSMELYGHLNTGGMLFYTLLVGAWEKIYRRIAGVVPIPMLPGSGALREILKRRIPDVKMHTRYREGRFKATECFREDSKDGNLILNFLVQIHDFRKAAPPEVVSDFMDSFKGSCFEVNDDLYFPSDEEDIVIVKE